MSDFHTIRISNYRDYFSNSGDHFLYYIATIFKSIAALFQTIATKFQTIVNETRDFRTSSITLKYHYEFLVCELKLAKF